MELIKIINARRVLEELADKAEVNAHLAYWMTKFIIKTESDHKFYATEMNKLLDKYAQDKDEQTFKVAPENIDAFNKAIIELGATDVEDPGVRFDLAELSSELKLSMKQVYPLMDFIRESE